MFGKKKGIGKDALVNLRCGNIKKVNKYWLKEEHRR